MEIAPVLQIMHAEYCRHSKKNKEWSTTTLKRELHLCVKLSFLEKRNSADFLGKTSYLQKYTLNFDETKSILLLKECSLRIFIWKLNFCIDNSQEWINHGRYQVFWDALYIYMCTRPKLPIIEVALKFLTISHIII